MTQNIQISGKDGQEIAVIGGENADQFIANVTELLGQDAVATIVGKFERALLSDNAAANVTAAFPGATQAAARPAVAPAAQPAQQEGPWTETDRWGSKYTYMAPGAPEGPNGTKVLKEGTSKAGKPYKAWISPTQTPHAYRNGIAKDESEAPEWL